MMVKGTSRRVIVVDAPDRKYFDQAIFILRSDAEPSAAQNRSSVVREASQIADRYMRRCGIRTPRAFPAPAWALLGAAAVSLLWLLTSL